MIIGGVLATRTKTSNEMYRPNDSTVQIDSSLVLAQKILGNDYSLKRFTVYIADMDLKEDSVVKVYLTKGSRNIKESEVLAEYQYSAAELENKKIELVFSGIQLAFNRDYYIIFEYIQPQDKGFIQLVTGSGNSILPLFGNDTNYGITLAYDMESQSRATSFFFVWKLLFVIGGYALAYAMIRRCSLSNTVGIVSLLMVLIVYIFGICDLLKYSYIFCVFLAVMSWGYVCIRVYNSEKDDEIFSQGNMKWELGAWIFSVLLCLICSQGKRVMDSDVVMHWAYATENIYVYDLLPIHANSNLQLYRYPPLYPLFQYIIMKIYGQWSEGILYFAKSFLIISVIWTCCTYKKMKERSSVLLMIVLCIGIPEIFFFPSILHSAYSDEILGVVFGFALVCVYRAMKNENHIGFELFLALTTLGLIKEAGVILLLIIWLSAMAISNKNLLKDHKVLFNNTLNKIGVLAFACSFVLWQIYIKMHQSLITSVSVSAAQNSITTVSGVNNNTIIDFLTGKAASYKYEIISIHLKKLLFGLDFTTQKLPISFVGWVIILCGIIYITACFTGKQGRKYIDSICLIVFSAVLYVAFLHVVYTFTMSEREALMIASEERYLGSFLVGAVLFVIYVLGNEIEPNFNICYGKLKYTLILSGVVMFLSNMCYCFREEIMSKEDIYGECDVIRDDSQKLRRFVCETDTVYYISGGETGGSYMYYNYDLLPARTDRYIFPVNQETWKDIYDLNIDELAQRISGYDYVYIRAVDNTFQEYYGRLFSDPTRIDTYSLYKVSGEGTLDKVY